MDEIDEKLERIKNFADEVETNPNLYLKAERLIGELYGAEAKARKQKRKLFWVRIGGLVSACAVACTIVIAVPFIYSKDNQVHRFLNSQLEMESIEHVDDFVENEKLDILYFKDSNTQSFVYKIQDTNESAILSQKFVYVQENIVDSLEVDICILNGDYERLDSYKICQDEMTIDGINIIYEIETINNFNTILAYFSIDSTRYYMTITNMNEYAPDGNLSEYVRLLLN